MLADLASCSVAQTFVLTDQTQRQCSIEHDCPPETDCPLLNTFTGIELGESYVEHVQADGRTG